MEWNAHHRNGDQHHAAFFVAAPRQYDAVGGVLRDAFRGDRSLPDEFAQALLQLDRVK